MSKVIDLTGQSFGKLVVLGEGGRTPQKQMKWFCKCECGKFVSVRGQDLREGKTKSCGCEQHNSSPNLKNICGEQFGKWIVIKRDYSKRGRNAMWICQCECGNTKSVDSFSLASGSSRSCGCSKVGNVKHGLHDTRLYRIYCGMKTRCYNPKVLHYKNYGGRGISICDEWLNSFKDFYDWAMANGYSDELSIDRINVNGNYEPSNCRWATNLEQARNKRNSKNRG